MKQLCSPFSCLLDSCLDSIENSSESIQCCWSCLWPVPRIHSPLLFVAGDSPGMHVPEVMQVVRGLGAHSASVLAGQDPEQGGSGEGSSSGSGNGHKVEKQS